MHEENNLNASSENNDQNSSSNLDPESFPSEIEPSNMIIQDINQRTYTLPNGLEIAYQTRSELDHFYSDIFEYQVYLKHGISLNDGDYVFDVGANIGFFTLFLHHTYRNIQSYSFEPAPPLFNILQHNVLSHKIHAKLFNCGLSHESATKSFTFYPNNSGMSSFYADRNEESDALRSIINNELQKGTDGIDQLIKHIDDLLQERLKSYTFDCHLTTISNIISKYDIPRIDLIKIDVQKSELEVILGIEETDWQKIRQIVIEVHNIDGRLDVVTSLLKDHGYDVIIDQDDSYKGSIMYNLYAIRHDVINSQRLDRRPAFDRIHARAAKQEQALIRQKLSMTQRKKQR